MSRPAILFTRSLVLAALVGGLAFSPNVYAATAKGAPTASQTAASAEKEGKSMSSEDRVEARIKELHEKLKITEDQSAMWGTVADTMSQNEKNVHALIQERHEKAGAQTALEDLESYQKITAAHAEAMGKFIEVFQPLYAAMSDEQKKNADTVFGNYEGHMGRRGHMDGTGSGKTK